MVAAPTPRPLTSPTQSWRIPSGRTTPSYQSPPISTPVPPARYSPASSSPGARQLGGQQALLQPDRELVLVLEDACTLERSPGLHREGAEQLPFALGEPLTLGQERDAPGRLPAPVDNREPVESLQATAEGKVDSPERAVALE